MCPYLLRVASLSQWTKFNLPLWRHPCHCNLCKKLFWSWGWLQEMQDNWTVLIFSPTQMHKTCKLKEETCKLKIFSYQDAGSKVTDQQVPKLIKASLGSNVDSKVRQWTRDIWNSNTAISVGYFTGEKRWLASCFVLLSQNSLESCCCSVKMFCRK